MRTIKELLILLRENFPYPIGTEMRCGCLCWAIGSMTRAGLISWEENIALRNHIKTKRPPNAGMFWWPYGELAPRLEFLDKLIAEIDEN